MVEQLRFRDPLVDTFYGTMKEFLGIQEIRVKVDFFAGKFQSLKESYHFPDVFLKPGKDENLFKMICHAFGFDVEFGENGTTFTKREYCGIEDAFKRITDKYQIFVLAPVEVDLVVNDNGVFVEYEI